MTTATLTDSDRMALNALKTGRAVPVVLECGVVDQCRSTIEGDRWGDVWFTRAFEKLVNLGLAVRNADGSISLIAA
jgi:hypothetical protein